MTQLAIDGHETPAAVKLGPRQQIVFDALAARSLTEDEAGALVHAERGKHGFDARCGWCAKEGRGVLASLRTHGLAVRRRSGQWERKDVGVPERVAAPETYNEFPEGF